MDGCKIINFLLGFFVLAGAMLLFRVSARVLLRTTFGSFKNDAFGKDFFSTIAMVGSRYGVFVPVTPLEVIWPHGLAALVTGVMKNPYIDGVCFPHYVKLFYRAPFWFHHLLIFSLKKRSLI